MTKRIVLNMDWGDNALASSWHGKVAYTEDRLRESVATWAKAGVTDVLWRVSCIGRVNQHSAVERISCAEDTRHRPNFGPMIEMVQRYDPLEQGVQACREHGLRIYAWLDMYDEYLPGWTHGKVIEAFPEAQFVDRSGLFYFEGVPNYAYEAVRQFKLRHVDEIVQYGCDGIYLSTRSHAKQWSRFDQQGMFGYNDPVLSVYASRTGVDLRVRSDWSGQGYPITQIQYNGAPEDMRLLYDIQGEFHTQYLAQIKEKLRPSGQELMVDLGLGEYDGIPATTLAPFRYEVDRWVREGIVDTVVPLTHLPGGWGHEQYYTLPEQLDRAGRYVRQEGMPIIVWVNVNSSHYEGFDAVQTMIHDLSSMPGADQVCGFALHEAATFEWRLR